MLYTKLRRAEKGLNSTHDYTYSAANVFWSVNFSNGKLGASH